MNSKVAVGQTFSRSSGCGRPWPLPPSSPMSNVIDPRDVLTRKHPFASLTDAYRNLDRREPGWVTVELLLAA